MRVTQVCWALETPAGEHVPYLPFKLCTPKLNGSLLDYPQGTHQLKSNGPLLSYPQISIRG